MGIRQIRALVRNGLYYLPEHADDEATTDGFDTYDVEQGILTGKIRKTWPQEGKYELVGLALDGRRIGVVCRITRQGRFASSRFTKTGPCNESRRGKHEFLGRRKM